MSWGEQYWRGEYEKANARAGAAGAVVAEMLALVPLSETIDAGKTGRTLVDWFKRRLALQPIAYMRDAQPDAEDRAYVVCAKDDPGAFPVYTP